MKRLVLAAMLSACAGLAGAQQASQNLFIAHCLRGCPDGADESNEIVVRHLFAASVNSRTRVADWAAYRVLAESVGVASLLPREWQNDQLATSVIRVEELDGKGQILVQPALGDQPESVYRISEFSIDAGDQGRLVPITSFAGTSYWPDLNRLSNMSLMRSNLRLESWSRLDQAINSLAQDRGELYVVAGPVYPAGSRAGSRTGGNPDAGRGESGILPLAFFKVVASDAGEVSAFLFDQQLPEHARYCDQTSDLATIEELTGLDLFPGAQDWPVASLHGSLGC